MWGDGSVGWQEPIEPLRNGLRPASWARWTPLKILVQQQHRQAIAQSERPPKRWACSAHFGVSAVWGIGSGDHRSSSVVGCGSCRGCHPFGILGLSPVLVLL